MRYQRRGINEDGQVANFVETEQVVLFKVGTSNTILHCVAKILTVLIER